MTFTLERRGRRLVITPIPGLNSHERQRLDQELSYERPGKEFMPNPAWAIVRLYHPALGWCPIGFHDRVSRILGDVEDRVEASRPSWLLAHAVDDALSTLSKPLRDYQRRAVDEMVRHGDGVIVLPTGAGKTLVAFALAKIMTYPAVVVVGTHHLKQQWALEAKRERVFNLEVVLYQSPKAKDLVKEAALVVFDECHHVAAKTVYDLAKVLREDAAVVGLTATPKREDKADLLIEAALGPIRLEVSRRELIDRGFLTNAVVLFLPNPRFHVPPWTDYATEYRLAIVENQARNELIVEAVRRLRGLGRRVLVLVSMVAHGQALTEALSDLDVEFVWSGSDRGVDLAKPDVIVATQILNEGMDFPDLEAVVIAGGGRSAVKLTQQVGRVLRSKPGKRTAVIVDVKDICRKLTYHSVKRRDLLLKEFDEVTWDSL